MRRDRPVVCRSVALASLALLGACATDPIPTGSNLPGPAEASASTRAAASHSPSASGSATASAAPSTRASVGPTMRAGTPDGRLVVRLTDGSFVAVDRAGVRPLAMPPGDWFLGRSAARNRMLLLPGPGAPVDAALGTVGGEAVSLTELVGDGSSIAGGGCVSPGGTLALADAETLTLALVDGPERTPAALPGHSSVGECAWLSDDALVTPAEHDHALLYAHRTGRGDGGIRHHGAVSGIFGRYPSTGGDVLSLTTGDADAESVAVFRVGRITGDGAAPPVFTPLATVRPGDGPRRGVHAVSADGRWVAVAVVERGTPAVLILAVRSGAREAARIPLPQPADALVFLEGRREEPR